MSCNYCLNTFNYPLNVLAVETLWWLEGDERYPGSWTALRCDGSPEPSWQSWRFWIPPQLPHLHTGNRGGESTGAGDLVKEKQSKLQTTWTFEFSKQYEYSKEIQLRKYLVYFYIVFARIQPKLTWLINQCLQKMDINLQGLKLQVEVSTSLNTLDKVPTRRLSTQEVWLTAMVDEGRRFYYLCLCHAVKMQVPPVGDVGQQVTVVQWVAVQMNTLGLDQQDHICQGDKSWVSVNKHQTNKWLTIQWTDHRAFLQETPRGRDPDSEDFFHRVRRKGISPAQCTLHYICCQFLKYTETLHWRSFAVFFCLGPHHFLFSPICYKYFPQVQVTRSSKDRKGERKTTNVPREQRTPSGAVAPPSQRRDWTWRMRQQLENIRNTLEPAETQQQHKPTSSFIAGMLY